MATNSQPRPNGDGSSHNDMHDLATALVAAMRQPKQLTRSQQRVELKFRMIRNGLGDFGGHGDSFGDRALIRMAQTDNGKGGAVLQFLDPLPQSARVVVASPEQHGDIDHHRVGFSRPKSIDVGFFPIALVEILDEFDAPVAAGVPSMPPAVVNQAVARTSDQSK